MTLLQLVKDADAAAMLRVNDHVDVDVTDAALVCGVCCSRPTLPGYNAPFTCWAILDYRQLYNKIGPRFWHSYHHAKVGDACFFVHLVPSCPLLYARYCLARERPGLPGRVGKTSPRRMSVSVCVCIYIYIL